MVAVWTEVDSACCNWVTSECPRPVTQAGMYLCCSQQPPAPFAFWLIEQLQFSGLPILGIILFLYLLAACPSCFLVTPFLLPMSDLPEFVLILFSVELQFFFFAGRRSLLHIAPFPLPSSLCFLMPVLGDVCSVAGFSLVVLSLVPVCRVPALTSGLSLPRRNLA